ncbi:MAG TPA: hypothetical protein VMT35_12445 [Ignavibacteriaceae bacterium]|nr:hypothetical protein [Ignavibacteriaceae bacterium]
MSYLMLNGNTDEILDTGFWILDSGCRILACPGVVEDEDGMLDT